MFEQYKKTFSVMQLLILAVTASILVWQKNLIAAGAFWLVMQLGALFGAVWAYSLRSRIQRRQQFYLLHDK